MVGSSRISDCQYGEKALLSDWHNVNGTFHEKEKWIVVGERKIDLKSGALIQAPMIERTTRHEFGHAYDHFLGTYAKLEKFSDQFDEFSASAAFRQAYEHDLPNVSSSLKERLAYFLQPDKAGREELFAQLFPLMYGEPAPPEGPENLFATAFPTVLALMKSIGSLDPNHLRVKDLYDSQLKHFDYAH